MPAQMHSESRCEAKGTRRRADAFLQFNTAVEDHMLWLDTANEAYSLFCRNWESMMVLALAELAAATIGRPPGQGDEDQGWGSI